jgi:7,8-dihydropterin-6-yl-methyl-4-(beta-D-ribofuranosyl)aminobenzene 5'-phosphate synthase
MTDGKLREADQVEITVLVDNYCDLLLPDTEVARRLRVPLPEAVMGEHGLSYLITVSAGDERRTVLMDAGISGSCLLHNAALLPSSAGATAGDVRHRLEDVEAMVLSHGHFDHFGGMIPVLRARGGKTPLFVHPDAFVERRIRIREDFRAPMPTLLRPDLESAGAVVEERSTPTPIAGDLLLLGGEVERVTQFEKGSPDLEVFRDGAWSPDGFPDDRGIAVNLRGKGLVVLGGCSHAGIVNTVEHFRKVTGVGPVYAVMGGFHLSGAEEGRVDATIDALASLNPEVIVPMHCTGWSAMQRFGAAMGGAFVLNSVGTTYRLTG